MKKLIVALVLAVILFTGCDGVNMNIDDLPRTLRISVKTLNDTSDTWDLTETSYLDVTSGTGTLSGTVGNITVTPAQNTYVRSDVVTATATDANGGDSLVFAYWLLPSRSTTDQDSLSTEGNIRYGTVGTSTDISLRTNYSIAQIYAAFAKDGNDTNHFSSIGFTTSIDGASSVSYTITLTSQTGTSDINIYNAQYRIFDENGEAITSWTDFIQSGKITVTGNGGSVQLPDVITGITDRSNISSWNVVILYEDALTSGNVYVVK